ncbi:Putative peptidoglycan binding domain protein [bacterium YEK0313]|nr:Putative peptidoglycan binding domain protein [bacterium YEK0313]
MRDVTYDEDDLRPRRARAIETDFDDDPPPRLPLWRQVLGRNKGDMLAVACAAFVALGIGVNALARQSGPHPAPLFAARVEPQAAPVPAVRPADMQPTASITQRVPNERVAEQRVAEPPPAPATPAAPAGRPRNEIVADIQRELARRSLYDGAIDGLTGPRTDAAIKRYESQAGLRVSGEANEQLLSHMRRPVQRRAAAPAQAPASAQSINQLLAADASTPAPRPQPPRPQAQPRADGPQSIAQLINASAGPAAARPAPQARPAARPAQ